MNQAAGFNLSPGYISGLAQTDGSFFCSVVISTKHRFGLQFRPKFTLTADLDSKYVLDSIAQYFGCGKVNINLKTHSAEYLVERIEDLQNIILPGAPSLGARPRNGYGCYAAGAGSAGSFLKLSCVLCKITRFQII